jgi:hypothetical protein
MTRSAVRLGVQDQRFAGMASLNTVVKFEQRLKK